MLTISSFSRRANVLPPLFIITCAALLILRFVVTVYDSYVKPAPVNLVAWRAPFIPDSNHPNLLDKPILFYFISQADVFDVLKTQAVESTIMKNREVAKLLKDNFECVKVVSTKKNDEITKQLITKYGISAPPVVVCVLPNGQVVDPSALQITDRLFASSLVDAKNLCVKVAADQYMQRGDMTNAMSAYARFLQIPGSSSTARFHALERYVVACRMTGHEKEATAALNKYASKQTSSLGSDEFILFLRGEKSADELWAEEKNEEPVTARFLIGMKYLQEGKKDQAIKNLRGALDVGDHSNPDYLIARRQLQSLGEPVPLIEGSETYSQDSTAGH